MTLTALITLFVLFIGAPLLVLALLRAVVKDFSGELQLSQDLDAQGPSKGYRS